MTAFYQTTMLIYRHTTSDGGADLPQRGQVGDLESVYEVVANSCHIVRCGGGDLGVV